MTRYVRAGDLRVVRSVTRKHGAMFAASLEDDARASGLLRDAVAEAGVLEWPDAEVNSLTPAQERYGDLVDQMVAHVLSRVRPVLAEAFVDAAREVLGRERERQS